MLVPVQSRLPGVSNPRLKTSCKSPSNPALQGRITRFTRRLNRKHKHTVLTNPDLLLVSPQVSKGLDSTACRLQELLQTTTAISAKYRQRHEEQETESTATKKKEGKESSEERPRQKEKKEQNTHRQEQHLHTEKKTVHSWDKQWKSKQRMSNSSPNR